MSEISRQAGGGGGASRGTEVLGRPLSIRGTVLSDEGSERAGLAGLLFAAVQALIGPPRTEYEVTKASARQDGLRKHERSSHTTSIGRRRI